MSGRRFLEFENPKEESAILWALQRIGRAEDWVPACGGTEVAFRSRSGRRLLYCWNRHSGQHAYLDLETDMILSNEEAASFMQMV